MRTHKDFVTGLPRSIYHAVERLVRTGFVEVAGAVRESGRPERIVYRATETGERRLQEWVRLLLAEPDANSTLFVPALSFAGCLAPATVAAALGERDAALAARVTAGRAYPADLPRVLVLEAEYEVNRLEAERRFVAGLLDDLRAGRLDWSTQKPDPSAIDGLIAGGNPE